MPHESLIIRATYKNAGVGQAEEALIPPDTASEQIISWLDDIETRGGHYLFHTTLERGNGPSLHVDEYTILFARVPEAKAPASEADQQP